MIWILICASSCFIAASVRRTLHLSAPGVFRIDLKFSKVCCGVVTAVAIALFDTKDWPAAISDNLVVYTTASAACISSLVASGDASIAAKFSRATTRAAFAFVYVFVIS